MELSVVQLAILGVVASILAQGYKFAVAKFGVDTSRKVIMVVVSLISVVLGYFWLMPTLPVFGDNPMVFVGEILSVAGAIVGFATLIYNWLLAAVFKKLNVDKASALK